MKKLLLLSFIAAFLTAPAFAQETKKDKQKDHSEWQQKIKDELKLSSDQIALWDALNKVYKEKVDAVKADASLDEAAQKAKKTELKKEKEAKFLEILNPDQQVKYKEMLEKKKKEAEAVKDGTKPAGN